MYPLYKPARSALTRALGFRAVTAWCPLLGTRCTESVLPQPKPWSPWSLWSPGRASSGAGTHSNPKCPGGRSSHASLTARRSSTRAPGSTMRRHCAELRPSYRVPFNRLKYGIIKQLHIDRQGRRLDRDLLPEPLCIFHERIYTGSAAT